MSKVLVVDDEPHLVRALDSALSRAGYEVATADGGLAAIERVATWSPDLVVLDLGMPGVDGAEVIRRLRPWYSRPILILSALSRPSEKAAALDLGADDFLQKPFGIDELYARLRALARRPHAAEEDARLLRFAGLEVDLAARVLTLDGRRVQLTPTEWRLLEALATRPDRLLTHDWLLREVWNDLHGDETRAALRTHMRALRAKLADDARSPRYVRTETGTGYRWVAHPVGAAPAGPARDDGPAPSGSPGASASAELAELDDERLLHALGNQTTSMRMAVQLLAAAPPPADPAELVARLDAISARLADIAREVDRRFSEGDDDDEAGGAGSR